MSNLDAPSLFKVFVLRNQIFFVAIILFLSSSSIQSFITLQKLSRFTLAKRPCVMSSVADAASRIKVLEIPLPYSMDSSDDSYFAWQTQEQQRLLNQMLIAQSISADPAVQIILITAPSKISESQMVDDSLDEIQRGVLRYLAEVNSIAWNECIARHRPHVQLHVISESLPNCASLASLLATLTSSADTTTTVEVIPATLLSQYVDHLPVNESLNQDYFLSLEMSLRPQNTTNQINNLTDVHSFLPDSIFWQKTFQQLETNLHVSLDVSIVSKIQQLRGGLQTNEVHFVGADLAMAHVRKPSISDKLRRFDFVAVGGTFDHLHPGHTLLLAVAASLCRHTMTIGVTSHELLHGQTKRKLYDTLLCDYETRVSQVRTHLAATHPQVALDIHALYDSCGPAVTQAHLQCIVVSSETLLGAFYVNTIRRERQMSPLVVVVVPRRDAVILSSSFIRQQIALSSPLDSSTNTDNNISKNISNNNNSNDNSSK